MNQSLTKGLEENGVRRPTSFDFLHIKAIENSAEKKTNRYSFQKQAHEP